MRQNKLKTLVAKILANFLILTVVVTVFYFIGQTQPASPAQAAETPRCGLIDNTCALGTPDNYHYDSSVKCWKWDCIIDPNSVPCSRCESTCGNDRKEQGEDCDGTDLNGQTCQSQGYDSGDLGCDSDCFFNVDNCRRNTCGNGNIDSEEDCDGSNFNGQTCVTLGFKEGLLKCTLADCLFDTAGCVPFVCGNGVKEGKEKCDGADFGGATCESLGMGKGDLACYPTCQLNTSGCTFKDPTVGCANPVYSIWSTGASFSKPCGCGIANKTVVETLNMNGLCSLGSKLSGFSETADGWNWVCDNESCSAEKKARCSNIGWPASVGDCRPNAVYESKQAWEDAKATLSGNAVYCASGTKSDNPCSFDADYNYLWKCSGKTPGNYAICGVGWAPESTCGTLDAWQKSAGPEKNSKNTYVCKDYDNWNDFFDLESSYASADTPNMCGAGSKLVKTSLKYINQDDGSSDGFDLNSSDKIFKWQCQADANGRLGVAKNCDAKLLANCSSGGAKCGPAMDKHFGYPEPRPASAFCELGQYENNVHYDPDANVWRWNCKDPNNNATRVSCQADVRAMCGRAAGEDWENENSVRNNQPCAEGALINNTIGTSFDGTYWYWYCGLQDDISVRVQCKANTKRCGQAQNRSYLATTFDSKKGESNFLCYTGEATDFKGPSNNSLVVDANTLDGTRTMWSWKCGETQCQAIELSCGPADRESTLGPVGLHADGYFVSKFNSNRNDYSTFLCSNGLGQNEGSEVNLGEDSGSDGKSPQWTWGCNGTISSDNVRCSANRYGCGTINNQIITKAHNDIWWSDPTNFYRYCAYGISRQAASVGENYTFWTCVGPNGSAFCQINIVGCGRAQDKYYYRGSLDKHLGKKDGFFCSDYATGIPTDPTDVTLDGNGRFNWKCHGSSGEEAECSAPEATCGTGDGKAYNAKRSDIDSFYATCVFLNKCMCNSGTTKDNMANPSDPKLDANGQNWLWNWQCYDNDGSLGSATDRCSAVCGSNCPLD